MASAAPPSQDQRTFFLRRPFKGPFNSARFWMNLAYHVTIPRKLRNCHKFLGGGKFTMGAILSESVFNPSLFTTKPKYRISEQYNSILCTKGAKWAFLDRVWSLQYESKGKQARAEGECVLRAEDEYCNHTRSKSPLSS